MVSRSIFKNLSISGILFYVPLFISVVFILIVPIYPSVDGAAHLYNSEIIRQLLFKATTPFNTYFEFNPVIVPNWLDHIFLVILLSAFNAIWAQKILLVCMVLVQAFTFKNILSKLSYSNSVLSCLIFPFIFSSFFYNGFYNQQISLCLFYLFIYWLVINSISQNYGLRFYSVIFIISLAVWFSNIITWAAIGCLSGLFVLANFYVKKHAWSLLFKRLLLLFIVFLPTLFLSFYFTGSVAMITDEKSISLLSKIEILFRLEPLIIFDKSGELPLTIAFGVVLLFLIVSGFQKNKILQNPLLLSLFIFCLVLLLAYFIIPNNSGAGLITYRLAIIFYLSLIIIAGGSSYKKVVLWSAYCLITGVFIGHTLKKQNGRIYDYAHNSSELLNAGNYLPNGATLWSVQMNGDWFEAHASNFAGINRSAIIYENYETYYPWFPLRFKEPHNQRNILHNELRRSKGLKDFTQIKEDYVLLYGVSEADSIYPIVKHCLTHGRLIYQSSPKASNVQLFQMN